MLFQQLPHPPSSPIGPRNPLVIEIPLGSAAEMPRVSESEPSGGKIASPGSKAPVRRSNRVVKPPVRLDL